MGLPGNAFFNECFHLRATSQHIGRKMVGTGCAKFQKICKAVTNPTQYPAPRVRTDSMAVCPAACDYVNMAR